MKKQINEMDIMYSLIEKSDKSNYDKKFYKQLKERLFREQKRKFNALSLIFNYKVLVAIIVLGTGIGYAKHPTFAKEIIENTKKCGIDIKCWTNSYGMYIESYNPVTVKDKNGQVVGVAGMEFSSGMTKDAGVKILTDLHSVKLSENNGTLWYKTPRGSVIGIVKDSDDSNDYSFNETTHSVFTNDMQDINKVMYGNDLNPFTNSQDMRNAYQKNDQILNFLNSEDINNLNDQAKRNQYFGLLNRIMNPIHDANAKYYDSILIYEFKGATYKYVAQKDFIYNVYDSNGNLVVQNLSLLDSGNF